MMELSDETRAFLRDWLDWVERGAPFGEPYFRCHGLCASVRIYTKGADNGVWDDLTDFFTEQFGTDLYPFGEEDFDRRSQDSSQHECPKRLAFVRQYAAERADA